MAPIHPWRREEPEARTRVRCRRLARVRCRNHPIESSSNTNHGRRSADNNPDRHTRGRSKTHRRVAIRDMQGHHRSPRRRRRRIRPSRSHSNWDPHHRKYSCNCLGYTYRRKCRHITELSNSFSLKKGVNNGKK